MYATRKPLSAAVAVAISALACVAVLFALPARKADAADQPIKIFTWGGPWTGYDLWDNQGKLKTKKGDTEDTDWYPTEHSLKKMRNADIVYIQNHGGVVTTHPVPFVFTSGKDHKLETDLNFPTDDDQGPSLILAWGCQNGNEEFAKEDGTIKDLLTAYGKGLGVLKASKTKVYIAPRIDVGVFDDTFQEEFFKEFGKGNVTAEQAARNAFETWRKSVSRYSGLSKSTFDEVIAILGNGGLTLDQIRANLAERGRAEPAPPAAIPARRDPTVSARPPTAKPPLRPKTPAKPPQPPATVPAKPPQPPATAPAKPTRQGLGRVLANQGGTLIRATIAASPIRPGTVVTISGSFKQKPVDQRPDPPIVKGPMGVTGGGKLHARIIGTPPVPGGWSLHNTNSTLGIYFEPRIGASYGGAQAILGLSGQVKDSDLSGTAEWAGPGRLTFVVGAPQGSGPLTGGTFSQSFTATIKPLELRPEVNNCAGHDLYEGDQVQAGGGSTLVTLPTGALLIVRPNSRVAFSSPQPGVVRIELIKGSCRVEHRFPGQGAGIEVKVKDKVTRLKGTDVAFEWDGKAGKIAVHEGAVEVTGEGRTVELAAGKQLDLASGSLGDAPQAKPEVINGLPAGQVIADAEPQEPGLVVARFADGKPDAGWRWEDPGDDCVRRSPRPGSLEITVPDGNDLWSATATAPRLLHKATGDFNLQARVQLACKGRNLAVAEFVLFSPGAYLGVLANQMANDGVLAHYRILGGGRVQMDGLSKVLALDRPLRACPDAPDPGAPGVWLRLSRRGDWWKTYWSLDGVNWNLSGRQQFTAPETLHVGWVLKRMARDGLPKEPAVVTFDSVELYGDDSGQLSDTSWDVDAPQGGSVDASGQTVRLSLDGTGLASVSAQLAQPLPPQPSQRDAPSGAPGAEATIVPPADPGAPGFRSDFDAIVQFRTQGWQHKAGEFRHLALHASAGDPNGAGAKNLVYIGLGQHDELGRPRYVSDLEIDGRWGRYMYIPADRTDAGSFRITRRDGRFTTAVWQDGQWVVLGDFKAGFEQPVFLSLGISNDYKARSPAAFSVEVTPRRLALGRASSKDDDWMPDGGAILQPAPLPPEIKLPQGMQGRLLESSFSLGNIFFGPDGTGYVFSAQQDKDLLLRIRLDGLTTLALRGELVAGVNFRGGAVAGEKYLISIDFWPGGGNRHGGLYELSADPGAPRFRPWKLSRNYGGMADIVPAPKGGWYVAEFESADNVFHVIDEKTPEKPLITKGEPLLGPTWLGVDAGGAVYVVNVAGGSPFAAEGGLYRITPEGQAALVLRPPGKTNFGGLAVSTGGAFGKAVLVSLPEKGLVVQVRADGSAVATLTGLVNPTVLRANPATGDLWVVLGKDSKQLLWVRKAQPAATPKP